MLLFLFDPNNSKSRLKLNHCVSKIWMVVGRFLKKISHFFHISFIFVSQVAVLLSFYVNSQLTLFIIEKQ